MTAGAESGWGRRTRGQGFSRKALPAVALGAFVLASVVDLWVALRGDMKPVPPERMRLALSHLLEEKRPGDLVVHSPLFRVEELAELGDLSARPDRPIDSLLSSRRVLVLDRADQPMYLPREPSQVIALDAPLQLRIYEPKENAEAPVFDLYESLTERTMRVERSGRITSRCTQPRAEGGYQCPGEPEWLYAAQRAFRIGGGESPCVWGHPTTGGSIVLELPAQAVPPEGRKLELLVRAGLADDAVTGTPDGATVTTEILQRGARKGRVVVPNRMGWFEAKVEIAPDVPVELWITTPRDGRRHHCLNAKIVERPR